MTKNEIDFIEQVAEEAFRNDGQYFVDPCLIKKLIAHVRRLEKVVDAVYECDAGNHYVTGLPLHQELLEALKECGGGRDE